MGNTHCKAVCVFFFFFFFFLSVSFLSQIKNWILLSLKSPAGHVKVWLSRSKKKKVSIVYFSVEGFFIYIFICNFPQKRLSFSLWPSHPPVMLLIGYINLVWYEWGMLRCCQLQSSPLFTNSLRSIDAGLLRGNDNINQSCRHNGPNQAEITGNVTMSYVSVAPAGRGCLPAPVRRFCPAVAGAAESGQQPVSSSFFGFCPRLDKKR